MNSNFTTIESHVANTVAYLHTNGVVWLYERGKRVLYFKDVTNFQQYNPKGQNDDTH